MQWPQLGLDLDCLTVFFLISLQGSHYIYLSRGLIVKAIFIPFCPAKKFGREREVEGMSLHRVVPSFLPALIFISFF